MDWRIPSETFLSLLGSHLPLMRSSTWPLFWSFGSESSRRANSLICAPTDPSLFHTPGPDSCSCWHLDIPFILSARFCISDFDPFALFGLWFWIFLLYLRLWTTLWFLPGIGLCFLGFHFVPLHCTTRVFYFCLYFGFRSQPATFIKPVIFIYPYSAIGSPGPVFPTLWSSGSSCKALK